MKYLFYKIILLLFSSFFSFNSASVAQTESKRLIDTQAWIDYYSYFYFKPTLQYYGDAGVRSDLQTWDWFMAYIRPSVRWKKHELWELHGGIGFFKTINVDTTNTFEIRPWQGLRVNWPGWKPVRFNHYIRIEERLNFITDNWTLEANLRFRYRLGANVLLVTINEESKLTLPTYFELFWDVGEQISEQFSNRTRLGVGISYKMNEKWTFEFHFVAQNSRTGSDQEFATSDRLLQLKLRHFLFKKDYHSKIPDDDVVY